MQLAIEHYEDLSLNGSNQAYVVAKFLKDNFLEMEKEQIIDAHKSGFTEGTCFGATTIYKFQSSKEYYKETYG